MIYMIQLKQIATIHVIFFPSLWLQALVKYQVPRNDIQDPWLKIPKDQSWQVVVLPLGIGILDLCTEKSSLVKYLQETALTCLWCYELNSMLDLKKKTTNSLSSWQSLLQYLDSKKIQNTWHAADTRKLWKTAVMSRVLLLAALQFTLEEKEITCFVNPIPLHYKE